MSDFGHPSEFSHEQKQMLRTFLRVRGWRRCGRTKKWEVYKKKVAGIQYRIKFAAYGPIFDEFCPKTEWDKAYWRSHGSSRWATMEQESDFAFITIEEVPPPRIISNEEKELDEYLDRLGCLV